MGQVSIILAVVYQFPETQPLLIVGAYGDAYVYERKSSGYWTEVKKLLASDGEELDAFGYSVSVSGNTAIIGAYRDDDKGHYSGSAYLYERDESSGNWIEVDKIASDGANNDCFGWSVSISENTAIVGVFNEDFRDDHVYYSGSAYVYERKSSGYWSEITKFTDWDGKIKTSFGSSVSIWGNTAVVGLYSDDAYSGSVYLFEHS